MDLNPAAIMGPRKEPPPLGTGAKSTSTTTTTTTPPQPDLNAERAGLRRTPSDAPIDEPTGGSSFPEIEVERTQESQNTTEKMKMGHEFELLNRERDGASNPSSSSAGSVPVYRTYKRRWFGVAQIVLMNIIVSWDVSRRTPALTRRRILHCRPCASLCLLVVLRRV